MATTSTKTTAEPTPMAVPPAVDPVKLEQFNAAVAKASNNLGLAANLVQSAQLARVSKDDFETDVTQAMTDAQAAITEIIGLINPVTPPLNTPPELDTDLRLRRDPYKPWPPTAN